MKQEFLLKKLSNMDSLDKIQNYIKQVISIRGFEHQPIEQKMLLLTEEVGEMAKAIRKDKTTMLINQERASEYDSIENEIADVFIVLLSICNSLNVNLYEALIEKETVNTKRNWVENSIILNKHNS